MNICLISTGYPPEDGGGIGTYVYNLSQGLKELGHKVYVITQTKRDDIIEEDNGVEIHRYYSRYYPQLEKLFPGLAWSRFLAQKIKELDQRVGIDIVEFPNWEGAGFWYLYSKKRKPVVTRVHTPYFETLSIDGKDNNIRFFDRFICWIEKIACKKSDHLISSTVCHRDLIAKTYKIQNEKFTILPLGIKLAASSEISFSSRMNGRPLKVLYVSRLEKRKGTTTFLQAIPKVCENVDDIEFVLVGKDRPHAPGDRLYKDYFLENFGQLTSKVHFYGFITDEALQEHYRQADIFAVPSLYESFGLIYVEAMMHGKPVIASKAGGIPEVVEDGQTGWLINPGDVDGLAQKICQLAKNQELRQKMGQNARALCERKFHYHRMAEDTERLYEKLRVSYEK